MQKEFGSFGDNAVATLQAKGNIAPETMGIEGWYHVVCRDKDGNIKWEEEFPNLVMAVGKQLMLDTLLVTASGYTRVGPYLGLINSGGTFTAADTFASHSGWTEFTNYTVTAGAQRGTASFGASTSSGTTPSNVTTCAASSITYTITGAGGTVGGCFLLTGANATAAFSNTTLGTLYSAGNFATAKTTSAGDTVAVTYSTTATS
jgi:hypothetical protein